MEKRRGGWGHFRQRDDTLLRRSVLLNLSASVGFLFLALIFLHLICRGVQSAESLYAYAALFATLEAAVIASRLYFYCHPRAPRVKDDVERQAEEKVAPYKWDGVSSYSEQGSRKKTHFNDSSSTTSEYT